jgi:glycosyltransferase involved in cell wall biosynthesis
LRVLFVTTSTTLGGAEKTVFCLTTLLNPRHYQVISVVSLKSFGTYAQQLSSLGFPTTTLGVKERVSLKNIGDLARIIDYQKPDIVHAVMYQAIQLCRLAKTRTAHKFKLVTSPRVSYRTRGALSLLVDRVLKGRDDLLIAECDASRSYLIKRLGYPPAKVKTIYNGIDVAGWPVSKLDRQQKRLELRLSGQDLLIGCIGRLDVQKGHGVLLDALSKLRHKHPVRCVIIGDGPKRHALEAQIKRLRLEKTVALLGERQDVTAWLSSFDVFCLPSLWEGLPNALLEAMALGLPVLASSVDGIPEVVKDGQNGLLVPPRQTMALTKRLSELAADPALRAKLGAEAQKTVFSRFTLTRMIGEYEAAYSSL